MKYVKISEFAKACKYSDYISRIFVDISILYVIIINMWIIWFQNLIYSSWVQMYSSN